MPTSDKSHQQQDIDTSVRQQAGVIYNRPQPAPKAMPVGSVSKESGPISSSESVPLVEIKELQEFEPEVESWLEKVERAEDIHLVDPVVDQDNNIVLSDPSANVVNDKLVLPLTHDQVEQGMKAHVGSGVRWLAEWCNRVIKMFGDQVRYRE